MILGEGCAWKCGVSPLAKEKRETNNSQGSVGGVHVMPIDEGESRRIYIDTAEEKHLRVRHGRGKRTSESDRLFISRD